MMFLNAKLLCSLVQSAANYFIILSKALKRHFQKIVSQMPSEFILQRLVLCSKLTIITGCLFSVFFVDFRVFCCNSKYCCNSEYMIETFTMIFDTFNCEIQLNELSIRCYLENKLKESKVVIKIQMISLLPQLFTCFLSSARRSMNYFRWWRESHRGEACLIYNIL